MGSHSKDKSSRYIIERSVLTSWREAQSDGPPSILNLVDEVATLSPITELKQAASITITILENIQVVKENKDAYTRLADEASGLIVAIWNSYKKAGSPNEWLSIEMREILEDLTHTLESICSLVQEHISRKKGIRLKLRKGDTGKKINEYREHLNYAMQKFELQSQININDILVQIMRKNDQLSEQIQHRNDEELNHALAIFARYAKDREIAERLQEGEIEMVGEISKVELLTQVEIDSEVEDDRWHSEELKKIEKETEDRKPEGSDRLSEQIQHRNQEDLKHALELSARDARKRELEEMKYEEEIERVKEISMAEQVKQFRPVEHSEKGRKSEGERLRAEAEEDNRRSSTRQAQSSKNSKSSREEDLDDIYIHEEEELEGNRSRSPKRRPVALEDITDEEDLQHLKSPKTKAARRKPSSTSASHRRAEETDDESTDGEDQMPPLGRKSRKDNRGPQSLPPFGGNEWLKDFSPFGFGAGPYLGPPMYSGGFISPPTGSHSGYLPGTIVNSGVGNIVSSIISNVGNNNSVNKVYR